MKIAVFGLGYVGMVTAACLADKGHSILGVETDPEKLDRLNRDQSPVVEDGLNELVRRGTRNGRIRIYDRGDRAIRESDMAMICVGTPGRSDGGLDTSFVHKVTEEIGSALKHVPDRYSIVIRSTLLPGTTVRQIIPVLQNASGKRVDSDFDICVYPEFMREGSSIDDFNHPPLVVMGVRRPDAALPVLGLCKSGDSPCFVTSVETAEMIKCACNSFHALKIAFANEIGSLCKSTGIDGREVMEILCADRKLNVSPAYLKPAFAFGGSCLPKDLRALELLAGSSGCDAPLLRSILGSNTRHMERTVRAIWGTGCRSVGLLGLSFKTGSDDVRESPMLALAKELLGKGLAVRIHDADVRLENLLGSNRNFLDDRLPDISRHMVASAAELVRSSDLIALGKLPGADLEELRNNLRDDQFVVDLIGIDDPRIRGFRNYIGLCW